MTGKTKRKMGRPPLPAALRRLPVGVKLLPSDIELAKRLGDGVFTRGVERALHALRDFEKGGKSGPKTRLVHGARASLKAPKRAQSRTKATVLEFPRATFPKRLQLELELTGRGAA